MQLNHIYFGGNLTAQPELKALPNGTHVVQFSIASNRSWKDANGQQQEAVEYGNCVLFGKQAETFAKYAVKGQTFLIEGRIQTRSWDDKESGKKMYRTEIVVERFHFGAKPQGASAPAKKEETVDDWLNDFATPPQVGGDAINPDDIPF